jgi:hypothetical protein
MSDVEVDIKNIISKARWSPRAVFPASYLLSNRVYSCGEGLYLLTNPKFGEGDPVRAVGWAESDYWAKRAWGIPPFDGELSSPPPQWERPPSLEFLSRPKVLSFGSVRDFESAQPGAKTVTLVNAKYRLTDGAFLYCTIHGTNGIMYIYASNQPEPADQPVAIEFNLPEGK